MNKQQRKEALMPGGIPRYIRVYDNPEYLDRYTVVFTGRYTHKTAGQYWNISMNSEPYHGIGMRGTNDTQIDRPTYSHLGKKIRFEDLPEQCQKLVIEDYKYLWDIEEKEKYK